MNSILSIVLLLTVVVCAQSAPAAEAKPENQTTEWRRLAFLPAIKPDARVYRHIVNLGRTDWRVITPLKLALEGTEGGVFAVKMNGKDLGEMRAAPFEVIVPKRAIRGETENELEITVRTAPAKPVSRIVLSGTYPTTKGPLLSELDFFTNRLDTTIPAFSGIPARVAAGDVAGARKIFADHVRRSLRPGFVLADWKAKPNTPAAVKVLRNKAALVQDHTLNTLGTSWHFEGPVEWEFNPTYNGYREWNYHISYFDCGDPLAELYLLTHDESLARSWRELLLSFISYNPVPLRAGAGATKCWRSLDTASRTFYLTRQLHAFITSPVCDDEFLVTLFRSIWEHGLRLRTGHAFRGNWFTNEMSSLARLTFFYPYFKETREWRDYALGRLQAELDRQVYPDGFQSELAPGYHGSVMRHFLSVVETASECGEPLPPAFTKGVERMFLIFPRLARPDLRVPGVNDSGNASGGKLARSALRHYPDNAAMKWFATARREGRPPEWLSCEMPYAGFAALRTSWDADGVWAFLDGGPFGMAHQHEDKLNVLLYAYGKDMIAEAGTFAYDTSEMRQYVLSTRAHNTVRIDGLDQNRRKGYRWKDEDITRKSDLVFRTSPSLDWAEAVYEDGYGPSKIPVRHARRLIFHKNESGLPPFFVVVDRLSAGDGAQHTFEQIWHLETCTCETRSDTFDADFGGGVRLTGAFSQPGLVDKKGQHEPEYQGWMPIHTGDEHEHRAVHTPTLCGKLEGALRIVTVFMPSRGAVAGVKGVRASSDPASKDYTVILSEGQERTFAEQ